MHDEVPHTSYLHTRLSTILWISSSQTYAPLWLFYLYTWSNFSRIIFLQTSQSPLSLPTFVKSMPTHLHILIQYKIVFLFFLSSSTSLFHLSKSFNHPNTSAFVNLTFLILNSYPILSSTLFSTFYLTDLTPILVLTSIMFSYLAWISLYGCYLTTSKILYNIYLTISATFPKPSSIIS